jgi:hypothetical protein
MKIFVDYIHSSSDFKDESKWVDYGLLIHLNRIFKSEIVIWNYL